MSRFTIRLSEEPTYIPNEDAIYLSDEFGAKCWQGDAIDKLADYEDAEEKGQFTFSCRGCEFEPDMPSHVKCCGCARMYNDRYTKNK